MNATRAIQDVIDALPTWVADDDRKALTAAGQTLVDLSERIADRSSAVLGAAGRRLVEGLPSDLAHESIIAILTTALGAVIDGMGDLPLDDDAVDAHLHGLRALEPIPGFDTPLESEASAAPEATDDEFMVLGAADALPFEQPTGEMLRIFQVEAQDLLSTCESRLLELETDPAAPGALADLFRSLHSFKGNCGFLGFGVMERLAHAAESLLVHVKESRRTLDDDVISALIYAVDGLVQGVEQAADGGTIPNVDRLVAALHAAMPGAAAAHAPAPVSAPVPATPIPDVDDEAFDEEDGPTTRLVPSDDLPPEPEPEPIAAAAPPAEVPAPARPAAPSTDEVAPLDVGLRSRTETTLRVDVGKIDLLLDLVGELIIAGTAVRHLPVGGVVEETFLRASAQLDRVVRSLQDVAMSLRMVPVGPTFQRMNRLVRDVSQKLGKQVELVVEGEDTEIDKTVAELMVDPLVHLIRNAIDHGLELPGVRTACGKPAAGTLRLSASHVGGEVWLQVEDDGKGLDRAAILARAIDRGLTEEEDSVRLTDAEVFAFIFEPGFSTAERVTDVSGRGVGMDVVHKNLQRVKGRVDIRSTPGQGAAFTLRIPLTLAIIEGMLVRVGASTFTVPLLNIRESVVVRPGDVTVLSTWQEMVRIRGELVPVLRMHRLYGIEPDHQALHDGILVVVEDGGRTLCLFVDELVGQRQTVIKAVSGWLGTLRGIAGCTVLGDGRISLILDVPSLLNQSDAA